MNVTKRDDIPSSLTPHELGKAMAELDLTGVPPHKRHAAVMDHLVHIMIGTIPPSGTRDDLIVAWLNRRKLA